MFGVGITAALGWFATYLIASASFEPTSIKRLTLTSPSANTLMYFLDRSPVSSFSVGPVSGAFAGTFLAALFACELNLQGFERGRFDAPIPFGSSPNGLWWRA